MSMKILLVEDDAATRRALSMVMTQAGHTVVEAPDGKQGVEKFVSQNPNLVLADYLLPIMSGVEMISEIRKTENGKNVPIIILTANDDVSAMNQAIQYNIRYYLNKTEANPETLLATIAKYDQ